MSESGEKRLRGPINAPSRIIMQEITFPSIIHGGLHFFMLMR